MKKFFVILVVLLFTSIAFADDGRFGENWCDEGGPLEGQCTIPGDEALTNYMWELGWYLAAVDNHDIAPEDVPERYIKSNSDADSGSSTEDSKDDDSGSCKSVTLPGSPNGTVTVIGELNHAGITYASDPIPVALYDSNVAGQTYDPALVGRKHKVKIVFRDADGDMISKKSYSFTCPAVEGGIDPGSVFP